MAYVLSGVTIRTKNTPEGMRRADALWSDIASGKLPVLFDSEGRFQEGISPVSRYSDYETDETGAYDLSVLGVTADFFAEMERKVQAGLYKKYEARDRGGGLGECIRRAWETAREERESGRLRRAFSEDYESAVPAKYTKDHRARCCLYISVEA